MKNKLLPVLIVFIIIATVVSCVVLAVQKETDIDTIALNRLKNEIERNKDSYSKIDDLGFDIIVIDTKGNVKYPDSEKREKGYDEWIDYSYENDCLLIDYSAGKIIVFKPTDNTINIIILVVSLFGAGLVIFLIVYYIFIQKTMFQPFRNLKGLASDVAAGNFEKPLPMDKHNAFGAFTESFDIMRAELKKSKEREIELEKSKKQLIAELSHDIKTPIASIKAVSALLELDEQNKKKLENVAVIKNKANEIDNLVTDLFSSALQDLNELKINIGILSSGDIKNIIKEADYLNKIKSFKIHDCLISADALRLTQIIGNIINNSYKYAGTEINITAEIIDDNLSIEFFDYGKGVLEEELPLLTNQFYRGKNSEKLSGAGLGLHICKTALERMNGGIDCYNTKEGFAVKIFLKLV